MKDRRPHSLDEEIARHLEKAVESGELAGAKGYGKPLDPLTMGTLESRRRVFGYLGAAALAPLVPTPALGDSRAPHIHFTVARGERRVLTSQMFVEGDPGNERDRLYRHLGREARLVTMRLAQSGATLHGQLDIVLA